MRIGSLFSGVAMLDVAVDAAMSPLLEAEGRHVWFCEFNPEPSKVLAARFPDVPNLGDVVAVDWTAVEPVDAVVAGWPCQPASQAGRRQGRADERWMWPEVHRALEALEPCWFFGENVPGLITLTDQTREEEFDDGDSDPRSGRMGDPAGGDVWSGFGDVLGSLADLGFDAEWGVLRSCDVGAPHRRSRLFITAFHAERVAR